MTARGEREGHQEEVGVGDWEEDVEGDPEMVWVGVGEREVEMEGEGEEVCVGTLGVEVGAPPL